MSTCFQLEGKTATMEAMFTARPELMTMQDFAEETGMTVQYARQLAREGRIPAVRIGQRRWYVPKMRFIEWLENGGADA